MSVSVSSAIGLVSYSIDERRWSTTLTNTSKSVELAARLIAPRDRPDAVGAEDKASRRRALLRARRLPRRRAPAGRAHGCARQGDRRPCPPPARRRSAQARRQGLRLRARAAVRPLAADDLASPKGPARRRHRRLRAPRAVGVLLRRPGRAGRAVRLASVAANRAIANEPRLAARRSLHGKLIDVLLFAFVDLMGFSVGDQPHPPSEGLYVQHVLFVCNALLRAWPRR